ncbi:DUF6932 family protein [Novosphingobium colocasiae]
MIYFPISVFVRGKGNSLIPPFNLNGVLPPFVGGTPGAQMAWSSPYNCTAIELVQRFFPHPATGVDYYKDCSSFVLNCVKKGIVSGFQWLDGSFTEDVEADGRQPNDIDVVTLAYRPESLALNLQGWRDFVHEQGNGGIFFDRTRNREEFTCDTFFVDLNSVPYLVARQAAYWSGLFSHRRETFQWKGMLALPLHEDDTEAIVALGGVTENE